MSLLSSIHVGRSALFASQVGLQVTGNNIANAQTPEYLRQRVVLETLPPQRLGSLWLGTGVRVAAITQETDAFLEDRWRLANSDVAQGEAERTAFGELEALVSELGEGDLSTALTNFFNSWHDVLNQPENLGLRNLAALEGQALADRIQGLDRGVRALREDINNQIINSTSDINRLTEEVAKLNGQIVSAEGATAGTSAAVGLRDRRNQALSELSELLSIRAVEQSNGAVNVYIGGDSLVFGRDARTVEVRFVEDRGLNAAYLSVQQTGSDLNADSGRLAGQVSARDEILGGFLDEIDAFTSRLVFEFNKVHSSGQGLTGYVEADSEHEVDDPTAALDQAGLPFTPVNGSFQVLVRNEQTGIVSTTDLFVSLNGLDEDTSLDDLASALDAIDGLSASVTEQGRLHLETDATDVSFAFAEDTSGVLAALGINTFFGGQDAADVRVRSEVLADPALLAASRGGIGRDALNAERLAVLYDAAPEGDDGEPSLAEDYDRLITNLANSGSLTRSVTDGLQTFRDALEGQKLAISGVNLDEEVLRMMAFQRTYQAAARFISRIDELLAVLVQL